MKYRINKLRYFFRGLGEMDGWFYRQMKEGRHTYLYKRWYVDGQVRYDVFLKKVEKFVDWKTEEYPLASSFRVWAWSFEEYDKAIDKFRKVEDEEWSDFFNLLHP